MVNYIKLAAIKFCDLVNFVYNPFQKGTYDLYRVFSLKLEEQKFSEDLERFVNRGKFSYELPMPSDRGDAALFQGLYTGMMNLKHEQATMETQEANIALGEFLKDGILVRGVREDGTINDTASNDSATGMLFGLYCIWRKGTWEADATIQRWADKIIDSGYALTDLDGKATKFGQLEQGWKSDPLRLTLLLGILGLAANTEPFNMKYSAHYAKIYYKYRPILPYPKVSLLWWGKDYDTHRAAIHLHILSRLTGDATWAKGLKRLARITEKENNAWVQLLCWPYNGSKFDPAILYTFSSDRRKEGNVERKNDVPSTKWGDKIRSKMALPFFSRGSQEFFWQRNSFSKDEWAGNAKADKYHSGLDFLLVYWMAVRLKLLGEIH